MQSRLVLLTFLDGSGGGNYPDNTLPGQPVYPSQGLPPNQGGPVDPGYGIPGYGGGHPSHPIHRPPVYPSGQPVFPPVSIDNTLPDSGNTPPPQISLPIVLPPEINPAPPDKPQRFELKYSVRYGWVLVPVESAEPK